MTRTGWRSACVAVVLLLLPAQGWGTLLTADQVRDFEVLGMQGERFGKVTEILVDFQGGRVAYLVIAAAETPGRKVVVPWRAVRLAPGAGLILPIQAERFRNSPFEESDLGSLEKERAIHRFFGVAPYWEESPASGSRPPAAPRGLRIVP